MMNNALDLNKHLIKNPSATFFMKVDGNGLPDASIYNGDLLVVDKSIEPYDGCIAVCYIDGEFALKRIITEEGKTQHEFMVWGVVRYSIRTH
ncbi:MAG: S24 family peptidase [Bacteroidales bacterium]